MFRGRPPDNTDGWPATRGQPPHPIRLTSAGGRRAIHSHRVAILLAACRSRLFRPGRPHASRARLTISLGLNGPRLFVSAPYQDGQFFAGQRPVAFLPVVPLALDSDWTRRRPVESGRARTARHRRGAATGDQAGGRHKVADFTPFGVAMQAGGKSRGGARLLPQDFEDQVCPHLTPCLIIASSQRSAMTSRRE